MKKKRKGCRNCTHGLISRHSNGFPVVVCQLPEEGGWDAIMDFEGLCDKHEWRFNSRICPKCGGRATKMLRLNKSKPYLCQQCDHEYSRPQEGC